MKEFKTLKLVASIFSFLAYFNIAVGFVFFLILLKYGDTSDTYNSSEIPMLLIVSFMIILAVLFSYLVNMSIASIIRIQIEKYNMTYENVEVSKKILEALKTSSKSSDSLQDLEFKMWKLKNPNKGLHDYFSIED